MSLEILDDVGVAVVLADSTATASQTKSALVKNPVSDRALDLWKTFSNFTVPAAVAAIARERERSRRQGRQPRSRGQSEEARRQNAPGGTSTFFVRDKMSRARFRHESRSNLASFASEIATATGEQSIPYARSPRSRAAKRVVPRPQNGSATERAFGCRLSIVRGNSSGNIVK